MPTGYTADIAKDITFEQFALRCARAFGALVNMRDDPYDAPIPDKIEPSSYYKREFEDVKKRLDKFLKGYSEKEIEKFCEKEYTEALDSHISYLKKNEELRRKYEKKLKEVRAWTPPSKDHKGLKDFMIKQIEDSIYCDCSTGDEAPPKKLSREEWLKKEKADIDWKYTRYKDEYEKEVSRAKERTKWIKQLKSSLK